MRIARKHRLDSMPGDLCQIGIIDASGPEVGDVAVATLMRTEIETGYLLRRLPDIPVEVPLAPHPPARRREQQLAVDQPARYVSLGSRVAASAAVPSVHVYACAGTDS